jgi:hypothetical protein
MCMRAITMVVVVDNKLSQLLQKRYVVVLLLGVI